MAQSGILSSFNREVKESYLCYNPVHEDLNFGKISYNIY